MKVKGLISEKTIVLKYNGDEINIQKDKRPDLYESVSKLIIDGDQEALVKSFLSIKERLEKISNDTITVEQGKIALKGETIAIPEAIGKKLLEIEAAGGDFLPLLRFWRKLQQNPDQRCIDQLYTFMLKNNIPLTEQGDIVVEKGVDQKRGGWPGQLVDCYTGHIDNSIGSEVIMERSKCNSDPNQTCSHGLHVAAPDYVRSTYANKIILECTVNPKDVVSVPVDYNATKMRCCRYQVRGYSGKNTRANQTVKLSDFITNPPAYIEDKLHKGISDGKERSESPSSSVSAVKTIKTKSVKVESKWMKVLSGMTAKSIIDYVQEKAGQLISLNPKNKKSIVKKGIEILEGVDLLDEIKHENSKIKSNSKQKKIETSKRVPEKQISKMKVQRYTFELISCGGKKLAVVKAIKEAMKWGLRESKDFVDSAPVTINGLAKRRADRIRIDVTKAGGECRVVEADRVINFDGMSKDEVVAMVKKRFNEKLSKFSSTFWKQAGNIFREAGYIIE